MLLLNRFVFLNLPSGPESFRAFRETGPQRAGGRAYGFAPSRGSDDRLHLYDGDPVFRMDQNG